MSVKQQTIKIIADLMKINKIKLEDLIKFIDLNDVKPSTDLNDVKPSTELNKPKKSFSTSIFTATAGKWGDEEVGLFDPIPSKISKPSTELVDSWSDSESEDSESEESEKPEELEKPEESEEPKELGKLEESEEPKELGKLEESEENTKVTWKNVVTKKLLSNSDNNVTIHKVCKSKQKFYKIDKKQIVSNLNEFICAIKEKKKLHIDFEIEPNAHCEHTFNGTLCPNVMKCGKIHLQRCIRNLDCSHKNCPYLHTNDMPDDEAKDNFIYSMEEYNDIKKNKRVSA
jgi:hypothetical protein